MTPRHETYDIGTVPFESAGDTETGGPASWPTRLRARLFAGRYDQQIEDGSARCPAVPWPCTARG